MDVLVLYSQYSFRWRKTISDHLYALQETFPEHGFFYVNCNRFTRLPKWLEFYKFDIIIYHYSFFSMRYKQSVWVKFNTVNLSVLSNLQGIKIALPQDEYNYTECLEAFLIKSAIDVVCTCANDKDASVLYPRLYGKVRFLSVLTGYVSLNDIQKVSKLGSMERRPIDVGYRARKLSYALGRHAQKKTEIATAFSKALSSTQLITDISTTDDDRKAFLGDSWLRFLLNCRVMLGCLGGASMVDRDGSLLESVAAYTQSHPEAKFDEVERAVFPGRDGEINLFALSPRHFECAITRTCQVLLEGDYLGVFEDGRNCVMVKEDYSNIDSVVAAIQDVAYCQKLADHCYEDVVESGKYNYASFARRIMNVANEAKGNGSLTYDVVSLSFIRRKQLKLYCCFSKLQILLFMLAGLRKLPVRAISSLIPARMKSKMKENKFLFSIIRKL